MARTPDDTWMNAAVAPILVGGMCLRQVGHGVERNGCVERGAVPVLAKDKLLPYIGHSVTASTIARRRFHHLTETRRHCPSVFRNSVSSPDRRIWHGFRPPSTGRHRAALRVWMARVPKSWTRGDLFPQLPLQPHGGIHGKAADASKMSLAALTSQFADSVATALRCAELWRHV